MLPSSAKPSSRFDRICPQRRMRTCTLHTVSAEKFRTHLLPDRCFSCCAGDPVTPGACLNTVVARHAAHAWRTAPSNLNNRKQVTWTITKGKNLRRLRLFLYFYHLMFYDCWIIRGCENYAAFMQMWETHAATCDGKS